MDRTRHLSALSRGIGGEVAEQNPLEDSPSEVEQFMRDAVDMEDVEDPNLGDVLAKPGEVVAVVDGIEIRHLTDESDHVLPIKDGTGEVIGKGSFPEVAFEDEPGGDD